MSAWPELPLIEVARLIRGSEPGSASYTDVLRGVPFLRVGDITGKTDNPVYSDSSDLVMVSEEDVLLSLDGSPGHVSIGHRGAISSGIRKVEPITNKVSRAWLRYSLMAPAVQDTISRHTTGVTILHASSAVPYIKIFVPPLPEQDRIVQILDEANQLRRLRAEADRRTADLIPALFHDMFGDLRTNPKGWPVRSLGELLVDGPQNGLYKHSSFYGDGTPILRIDAFYDGEVKDYSVLKRLRLTQEELQRYQLRENDIVVNRVNSPDYLGKSALITMLQEPTVFESNMMRLSISTAQLEPIYAIRLLQTSLAKRHILARAKHAINQSSINQEDIKSLPIPVPPLARQREFAARVAEICAMDAKQAASRRQLDDLFSSFLHRAFQGEL